MDKKCLLSEKSANIVENIACRVAEKQKGIIIPTDIISYVPLSLELIKSCLDEMVDDSSVFSDVVNNIITYKYEAYSGNAQKKQAASMNLSACVCCDADLDKKSSDLLCSKCRESFENELSVLAEKMGWPAEAVYEHEIFYLAAKKKGPLYAENLSGYSRYTLRSMRNKLKRLCLDGYLSCEKDKRTSMVKYYFPSIKYSKEAYQKNRAVIRTHPASFIEEVQTKVVHILFSLGVLFLGLTVLAFLHVPFIILIMMFLVLSPIMALVIWKHKKHFMED